MTRRPALQPTATQPGQSTRRDSGASSASATSLLYYVVTGFSLRWVAVAAAAGPSALVIWVVAALGFFVPLVFCVLELSSRYPEEGGIYVWSKRAFGPFAAFITGWTYWGSNLPYLPGLLYYAAANALFMGGPAWQSWSSNSTYFIAVSMAGLARRGDDERRRAERREVARPTSAPIAGLDSGDAADGARRRRVEPVRIGDADHRARARAEHAPQGHHLLVHDRLRVRRRRKRIDDGRGDRGRAADRAARDPDCRRRDHRALHRGDAGVLLAMPKEQVSGLSGHHAGDSGDDREGRDRMAGAGASRRW